MRGGSQTALLLSVVSFCSVAGAALEQSVSPSGQFVIYGGDGMSRAAVSILAEQTKRGLLDLLRRPDEWKTPIVINLQPVQANLPEIPPNQLRFSQTGFGLKLQLDLIVGRFWRRDSVEHELLRTVILEIVYRHQPQLPPGTVYVEPPDWLLDGLLISTPGRDREPLLERLAASGKLLSLEELLRERPEQLDSPARELYRSCAFALVQYLLGCDNGRALARYIDHLSEASNDPMADLRRFFPDLAGAGGKKIWRSEIEKITLEREHQLLGFAETERKLEELLTQLAGPSGASERSSLSDLAQRKISAADRVKLTRLKFNLLLLATRANPVLRPTVQDYQKIVAAMAAGKNKGAAAQIARIETLRHNLAARMSEIDDYLNWFEAAKLQTDSGLFDPYVTAAENQEQIHPRRRDPLSIYLDALEEQF